MNKLDNKNLPDDSIPIFIKAHSNNVTAEGVCVYVCARRNDLREATCQKML